MPLSPETLVNRILKSNILFLYVFLFRCQTAYESKCILQFKNAAGRGVKNNVVVDFGRGKVKRYCSLHLLRPLLN